MRRTVGVLVVALAVVLAAAPAVALKPLSKSEKKSAVKAVRVEYGDCLEAVDLTLKGAEVRLARPDDVPGTPQESLDAARGVLITLKDDYGPLGDEPVFYVGLRGQLRGEPTTVNLSAASAVDDGGC